MITPDGIKSAIKEMDQVSGDPKKTKRQTTPSYIAEALIKMTKTSDPYEEKMLEGLMHEIGLHTAALSMDTFKFSLMTVYWPQPKDASWMNIYNAIKQRNLTTASLAKDGVALSFHFNKENKFAIVIAEDTKGRKHPLVHVSLKDSIRMAEIGTGDDAKSYPVLTLNEWTSSTSNYPGFVKDGLHKICQQLILIEAQSFNVENHKPLWYCGKEGIQSKHPQIKGAFPAPLGYASINLHAQVNKIDPSFITKIANAVRIGPTQKTMLNTIEPIFAKSNSLTRLEMATALTEMVSKSKDAKFHDIFEEKDISQAAMSPKSSHAVKVRLLADAWLSKGKMFNPKPRDKRQHNSIPIVGEFEPVVSEQKKSVSSPKAPTVKNTSSTEPKQLGAEQITLNNMKEVLEKSGGMSLDKASEMVKCMHPDGVDITPADVQSLCTIIDLAQQYPELAEHSVAMFAGIIKEKGRVSPVLEQKERIESPSARPSRT